MAGEDDFLEAAYEDKNGDPHGIGSPDSMEWDLSEELEPECDQCGAAAGDPCYSDCPYVIGMP